MGCDIHVCIEVRKDGVWHSADQWASHRYGRRLYTEQTSSLTTNRNYAMFSVLADCRNSDERPIPPIWAPQGLPSDLSERVRHFFEEWESNTHHVSYVSLRQLVEYPWYKTIELKDVNIEDTDKNLNEEGQEWMQPEWYSEFDIKHRDRLKHKPFKKTTLHVTVAQLCFDFLSNCMPQLLSLGHMDDVRIVFGFDN